MSAKPTQVQFPRWLHDFTTPDPCVNLHYERIRRDSDQWIRSFGFDAQIHKEHEIELLSALVYPSSDYNVVRLGADLFHFLFVVDGITDHEAASQASATCEQVRSGLDGHHGWHNSKFTEAMADIFTRYVSLSGENSAKRFTSHMNDYLKAVVTQVSLREQKKGFYSVREFTLERRDNSAALPCFDIIELALGIDLPPIVYNSQEFTKVYLAAADIVCIGNDVYSFSMEKALGHTDYYNFVTVYMEEYRFDIVQAIDHADKEVRKLFSEMALARLDLPSFGKQTDEDVNNFIDGLLQWIDGYIHWTFKTTRYFGESTEDIRDTHVISL
ncbi:hypothetical protein ONZ45_g4063 [Pleurotus djamor]|nr:hypothetical protein ONZ45_g4063 [Pleurotus djamor]